ncbi:MAG: class I SAM-dependent methyltransferase [Chloroflexi bacterium]|nr:class I SAM-dependent methyltransferase [Chloroflexota bacterium]
MSSQPPIGGTDAALADAVSTIAPYYDLDFGQLQDDCEMYRGFAQGARVLELGAGTGRVAAAVAGVAESVTALEQHPAMIDEGAARYQEAGVEVIQQDMRRFALPGREFDLVICALSSFCHLQSRVEQCATLAGVAAHLAPDGRAIFDLPALTAGDWETGPRPVVLEWIRRHPGTGRQVTKWATLDADPASQTHNVTYIYDEERGDGSLQRAVARFPLRYIFRFEMAGLLEVAGMELVQSYGGYDLAPAAAGERLIVVAQRASRERTA